MTNVRLCGRRLQYANDTSCFWITEPASLGERTKISPKRKHALKGSRKTALSNVLVKLLSIHLSIPSIIFSKICFVMVDGYHVTFEGCCILWGVFNYEGTGWVKYSYNFMYVANCGDVRSNSGWTVWFIKHSTNEIANLNHRKGQPCYRLVKDKKINSMSVCMIFLPTMTERILIKLLLSYSNCQQVFWYFRWGRIQPRSNLSGLLNVETRQLVNYYVRFSYNMFCTKHNVVWKGA